MKIDETREEFYKGRNSRTEAYLDELPSGRGTVRICPSEEVMRTRAGQLCTLALVNQLVRIHRRIDVDVTESISLEVPSIFGGHELSEELQGMVKAIDPYGDFRVGSVSRESQLAVGIGAPDGTGDLFLGFEDCVGSLRKQPAEIGADGRSALIGASVAATLGASAVLHHLTGQSVNACRLSGWNFQSGDSASLGPKNLPALNLGRVLLVGAGAVGSSLAYWLSFFEDESRWTVIDPDLVEVSNTNRGPLFTANDAGWPLGPARSKANLISDSLGDGSYHIKWFDNWKPAKEKTFDIGLCLANERGVRSTMAHYPVPVVLHATTGRNFLAEFHRHIAGRDDCIRCRMSDFESAEFTCSRSEVRRGEDEGVDAALPFLSAGAGLMLLSGLFQLQTGALADRNKNLWRWHLQPFGSLSTKSAYQCEKDCGVSLPDERRVKLYPESKWRHLDPAFHECKF